MTFYANTTIVNQIQITLTSRNSTSIVFTWNTTGSDKGNYTISAYAILVDGEMYMDDNNFTDSWVFVTIAGDVTSAARPPDGIVNMRDIDALCDKFMTTPSDPEWDPTTTLTTMA